ncbi:hypothetical protein [Leptospira santarosai]|uniref:hypothetical protein n=1 Tax=Leptospira santarosai TaxID=28183 RepID=UPI0024AF9A5F|nr:hypothetical protein [Leptospira santarosai]MDI7225825.1 hypothetical protein [Leptospira santarosai]
MIFVGANADIYKWLFYIDFSALPRIIATNYGFYFTSFHFDSILGNDDDSLMRQTDNNPEVLAVRKIKLFIRRFYPSREELPRFKKAFDCG